MEVGEEHLTRAQKSDLVGVGLFHLDHELGLRPSLAPGHDARAYVPVDLVREAAAEARSGLHQHLVAQLREGRGSVGHEPHAKLLVLALAYDADTHISPPGCGRSPQPTALLLPRLAVHGSPLSRRRLRAEPAARQCL